MDKITENYFIGGNVLYAIELNTIIAKINEIIDKVKKGTGSSSGSSSPLDPSQNPVTIEEIDDRIDEAVNDLHQLIDDAENRLNQRIEYIEDAEPGSTFEYDDEHLIQLFKQVINDGDGDELVNAVLLRMGIINNDPSFDVTVYQNIQDLMQRVSTLELLPAQVSLLVEERNGQNVLKRAAIIAAINNGTSEVGISADKIILDGQTLATKFAALNATVQNLDAGTITSEQLETVTANVVDRLESGDVVVHGTLYYNRIVGNVTTVSSNTTLSDTAYYVDVVNSDGYNPLVITFPASPVAGQTLFIGGSRFYKVKTTQYPINYYYDYIEPSENYKHYLRSGSTQGTASETAQGFGWYGVVEFIFTGTAWQQLVHNISLAN